MLSSQIMSWRELIEQLEAISATLVPLLALDLPQLFPENSLSCLTEESCELIIPDTRFRVWLSTNSYAFAKPTMGHRQLQGFLDLRLSGARAGTDRGVVNTLPSQLFPPLPNGSHRISRSINRGVIARLPHGACVVSANKMFALGKLADAGVLIPRMLHNHFDPPPLRDNQVLIIQGVEATVTIKVAFPTVKMAELDKGALQLDQFEMNSEEIADLLPEHVDRELLEAFFWRSTPEIYALGTLEHCE
ncbi:hypothetical protein PAAG_06556 [Paracoccidioides lutzii Pb01]|uniref:Uncharacterized protein n=1 Tax=Paracoccidioides lutzii (strain ATCC MYA-826 / Pb01) TaxID=502779 RepID=C1H715_PARBA|nr:hypothetical protein PAAG_06556 [Paracoccidioides lutzii Pb01]EEH35509.2 hypothetical protein PAAG_06556 [Paracoccidioides lutzii Pb01]